MEIGKPKRIYRVEPLRDPLPSKREHEPAGPPAVAPAGPKPVPAR
ncbi:MAG TPA: hypothetical protein VFB17_05570 [Gaiellaceae bacterium]|nr:hypothetical protein [Gaiellaceae bacterium]